MEEEDEEEGAGQSSGRDEKRRREEKKRKQMQPIMSKDTKWAIFSFGEGYRFRWIVYPVYTRHTNESLSRRIERNPAFPPKVHYHGADQFYVPNVSTFLSDRAHCYSVAVVDSVMYIAGGFYSFTRSLKMFDLLSPTKGIEIIEQAGPDMICARRWPLVLTLNKKLYVLGGHASPYCPAFDPGNEGPWGEMYDPLTRRWCPLPPPQGDYFPDMSFPLSGSRDLFWATVHSTDSASIIIGSYKRRGRLVLYKLDEHDVGWSEKWIAPSESLNLFDSFGLCSTVTIGRNLLWFAPCNGRFVAFNLDHHVWFVEKLKSFVDPDISDFKDVDPHLAVLYDGKYGEPSIVCLVFVVPYLHMDNTTEERYLLHCLKFKVQIDPLTRLIVSSMLDCQCTKSKVQGLTSFGLVTMG